MSRSSSAPPIPRGSSRARTSPSSTWSFSRELSSPFSSLPSPASSFRSSQPLSISPRR